MSGAIFDLDRTLLPGSSLVHVARRAMQMGLLSGRALARGLWDDARYRLQGATDAQVRDAYQHVLSMAKGLDTSLMQELADEAAPLIVADMRPDVRARLDHHLELGDTTVVLSASPDELVHRVAAELGAHHGLGSRAQVINGVYTGHLDGEPCYGPGKINRLLGAGLAIDPVRSFAYADSFSDRHLLRWVGHAIVVSPDTELRELASLEGWPVIEADRTSIRSRRMRTS